MIDIEEAMAPQVPATEASEAPTVCCDSEPLAARKRPQEESEPQAKRPNLSPGASLWTPPSRTSASSPSSDPVSSSMGRGRKRPLDDLTPSVELPAAEAEAVACALEKWRRLRPRAKALEPALRREGALVQEILDTGLRVSNRRMLRKLTQSSANGDAEETIQEVGEAIGANHEMLERVLKRNHGELVKLSAAAVPDMKEEVLREMDEVLAGLRQAWNGVRSGLLEAKSRADMAAVRQSGRSLNDLKPLMRRLDDERRLITRNSELATLLVTVCCRVLPVRQVDPAALRNIPPSHEGYQRIMDFYFFTDASLYCFGDRLSGPNWFARLKRNVAILHVTDQAGGVVYNNFSVSGEHSTPGAPLAPMGGPLLWTEAEDKYGRVFDRRNDAEFKLLSGLCAALGISDAGCKQAEWRGAGTLWSRKPLCASCWGAVQQLAVLLPRLRLSVSVGEPGCSCRAAVQQRSLGAPGRACATRSCCCAFLPCSPSTSAPTGPEVSQSAPGVPTLEPEGHSQATSSKAAEPEEPEEPEWA